MVAVAGLRLGGCLKATSATEATTTTTFALQALLGQLNRSQADVDDLEDSIAAMHQRVLSSEQANLLAYTNISDAQAGLTDLEQLANASRAGLTSISQLGARLNSDAEAENSADDQAILQANRVLNTSTKLAAAVAQLVDPGTVKLRDGICLDAPEPDKKGSGVRMWTCLTAVDSQEWDYDPATGQLWNRHGICLDAPPPQAGASAVVMWTCDRSLGTQRWAYNSTSGQLRGAAGTCLAAQDPRAKGGALQLQPCSATAAEQQWGLVVGGIGAKRALDELNKQIWDVMDPKSPNSVDETEKRVRKVEANLKELKGVVSAKVQTVLVKRLRQRVDGVRSALKVLGTAATDPDIAFDIPDSSTLPPLGADLGLDA